MKFYYWQFASLYFLALLVIGLVGRFTGVAPAPPSEWHNDLNQAIVLLGIMNYIDYKMGD